MNGQLNLHTVRLGHRVKAQCLRADNEGVYMLVGRHMEIVRWEVALLWSCDFVGVKKSFDSDETPQRLYIDWAGGLIVASHILTLRHNSTFLSELLLIKIPLHLLCCRILYYPLRCHLCGHESSVCGVAH